MGINNIIKKYKLPFRASNWKMWDAKKDLLFQFMSCMEKWNTGDEYYTMMNFLQDVFNNAEFVERCIENKPNIKNKFGF